MTTTIASATWLVGKKQQKQQTIVLCGKEKMCQARMAKNHATLTTKTTFFQINSYFIVLSLIIILSGYLENKEDPHCYGERDTIVAKRTAGCLM